MYWDEPIGGYYARHLLLDGSQNLIVSLFFQYREEESVHHDMRLLNVIGIRVLLREDAKHHVDHLIIEVLTIKQLWQAALQVELRAKQIQLGLARR